MLIAPYFLFGNYGGKLITRKQECEKANEHEFHEHWLNPCDITL